MYLLTYEIKSEREIIKAGQTLSHIYSKGHYGFYGEDIYFFLSMSLFKYESTDHCPGHCYFDNACVCVC